MRMLRRNKVIIEGRGVPEDLTHGFVWEFHCREFRNSVCFLHVVFSTNNNHSAEEGTFLQS